MKRFFLLPALVVLVLTCQAAFAQSSGFNLFQTGSGTIKDLSNFGLGVVTLQGVPIQSITGNADTIVQRSGGIPGNVPLNIFALFLKSTQPVTLQGLALDVYATVNNSNGLIPTTVLPQPDSLSGSGGAANVRTDGTFDLSLTINADVILVRAGASVTDPRNWVAHRPGSTVTLNSTNSPWQTTAPSGYPISSQYPANGFFVPFIPSKPHPVVAATILTAAPAPTSQKSK